MAEGVKSWCIKLVFCDQENNGFVMLGGLVFDTKTAWERAWASIPRAQHGWGNQDALCANKLDAFDQVDERPITAGIAVRMLGKPLATLIKEGREKSNCTLQQSVEMRSRSKKQELMT
jgi:hypothetical protein